MSAEILQHPALPAEEPPNSRYVPDVHLPADMLHLYFGFVPPPPSIWVNVPPPTVQQVKDLALGIGYPDPDTLKGFIDTPVGKAAVIFFWPMAQAPWVPPHSNTLFDMAAGNPQALTNCRRLNFLHQLPGDIVLFDFNGESTMDWKIGVRGVRDITDALFIVRLDQKLSDFETAWQLVLRGMPFFTLLHTSRFVVQPLPRVCHRIRLCNYEFGLDD